MATGASDPLTLRLFVANDSVSGVRARAQLDRLRTRFDDGGWTVEVVDVLEHPELAEEDRVLATPTLVRRRPVPPCKIIGDLGDWDLVTAALGLTETAGRDGFGG